MNKTCNKCGVSKPASEYYKRDKVYLRSACKSCCNNQSAQWRKDNPERAREIVRNSAKRNPQTGRNQKRRLRERSPEVCAARDMLKRILALTGEHKASRTEKAIGYTYHELRIHLESQFCDGMSWDNWGEWHIDHIHPVNLMVKQGITDPKEINALSNLRPIWADENIRRTRREYSASTTTS